MPGGRRHLNIREDVWRLLEEGARRRGFNRVVDYVTFLVNMDLAGMDTGGRQELRAEYMYTVMVAGYTPYSVFLDLYVASERAGWSGGGYSGTRAFEACLTRARQSYARIVGGRERRLCSAIVDMQLAKSYSTLAWMAMQKCERGFRIVVEADRQTLRAEARYECLGGKKEG